ncbi:hypothetical protein GCM10023322_56960 [Rugosimonospora acidiphila]|uniref:Glycosyl hydrolase catalytic core n=1 Tax=Rugosimonospora acidiphila TaxID=556531 RepID=A0ABP9SCZ1_9ACTN
MHLRPGWRRLGVCAAAVVLSTGILAVPPASADAPALTITAPTLVFTKGDTHIAVATPATKVAYIVTDEQSLNVTSGTSDISGGTGSIDLSSLGPGYYNLTVGAGATLDKTTFAVLSSLPSGAISPSSPFGIGMHATQDSNAGLIPTVAQVGFGTVRFDLKWADAEQSPGVYNFPSNVDAVVNAFDQYGITPLPIANYTNPLYDGGNTPSSPTGLAAMAKFMSQIVTHYPSVKGIEVFNEFNEKTFNNTGCLTAACYAPMLATAYAQLKADHPNVTVAGPSTFQQSPTAFLDDLWNLGGLNNLDTVSVHPYLYPSAPEGLVPLLSGINASIRAHNNGKSKPIWITEDGWTNGTNPSSVDEATSADDLIRAEALAMANGVTQFDWYDLVNDGTDPTNVEHNFGLMRLPTAGETAVTPKPALVTQAVTIRQLAGLTFSGDDGLPTPAYSERFGSGAATTRVMWSSSPTAVTLSAKAPVTVTDEYGRATQLAPDNGTVTVDLTQHPVFVKGSATNVRVAATPRFSATVWPAVAVGDTAPATLTVDRRHSGGRPGLATFRFGDATYTVPSRPNRVTTASVDLPASTVLGKRDLVGQAGLGKKASARLVTTTQTVTANTMSVQPAVTTTPFGASLAVNIANNRHSGSTTISSIDWSVGADSGTLTSVPDVAPGTTATVNIPAPSAAPWQSYPFKVTVNVAGAASMVQSGQTGFDPITPDGSTTMPPIDLATDGKATYTPRPYGGAADLSGTVALHSSAGGLHVSADITDDVLSQKNPASTMYLGDSLQVAVTPALPGASPNRVEFGIGQTSAGPQVYCFAAAAGQSTGLVDGTGVQVTRTGTVTHYDVTLPWDRLGFAAAPSAPFGISVLVNDDDSDGFTRPGFIEWGSGIATSKSTALTYPAELATP